MSLIDFIKLLRIHQWLKNLMLYFPSFLSGTFLSDCLFPPALFPFLAFCVASSATYIFNDIFDKENDSHHPHKQSRPIASGKVSVLSAILIVIVLLLCSVFLSINVSIKFCMLLVIYIAVSLAYSAKLKEIALVDIFCISTGFLLRLQAGGMAFSVPISEWLFLSVFLLSVFLSTGKRYAEKQCLGASAQQHRKALTSYPKGFLEGSMYMTGGAVLVTYTMYVISRHSHLLLYSVPLCCFGLLRYLLRVLSGKGGDPTESLMRDVPLLIVGVVWVGLVGWGIYGR